MTIWLAIIGNSGRKFGNDTKFQHEFTRILFECQHCYALVIGEDAVKGYFDRSVWSKRQKELRMCWPNLMNIANPAHRYYKLWMISFQNQKQEAGESINLCIRDWVAHDCQELCSWRNHTGWESAQPFGPWSLRWVSMRMPSTSKLWLCQKQWI